MNVINCDLAAFRSIELCRHHVDAYKKYNMKKGVAANYSIWIFTSVCIYVEPGAGFLCVLGGLGVRARVWDTAWTSNLMI